MIFCEVGTGNDLFTNSSFPLAYFAQISFKGAFGFDLKDLIFFANKLFLFA